MDVTLAEPRYLGLSVAEAERRLARAARLGGRARRRLLDPLAPGPLRPRHGGRLGRPLREDDRRHPCPRRRLPAGARARRRGPCNAWRKGVESPPCEGGDLAVAGHAAHASEPRLPWRAARSGGARPTISRCSVHFVRDALATTTTALANDIQFDIFTDGPAADGHHALFAARRVSRSAATCPIPSENCTNGATGRLHDHAHAGSTTSRRLELADHRRRAGHVLDHGDRRGRAARPEHGEQLASRSHSRSSPPAAAGDPRSVVGQQREGDAVEAEGGKPGDVQRLGQGGRRAGEAVQGHAVRRSSAARRRPARRRRRPGSPRCRYATKKTDKGKTLAGSMKVTASGKSFTKRFTARLG